MENDPIETEIATRSAKIYIPLSAGITLAFLLAANLIGNYSLVAKIGGGVWVAILSLIISMPVVISRVKRAVKQEA